MSLYAHFTCNLPNGLHARPAAALANVAAGFESRVVLVNVRTGAEADARSVLSLVSADLQRGDEARLAADGPDAAAAVAALEAFVRDRLPDCDEAPLPPPASAASVPPLLRRSGAEWVGGVPLAAGLGRGQVVELDAWRLTDAATDASAAPSSGEPERLRDALETVGRSLESRLARTRSATESGILKAHLAMVRDPAWRQALESRVAGGRPAAAAAVETARRFMERLRSSASEYLRERAADVLDIALQVLQALGVDVVRGTSAALEGPSVVMAAELTPGRLLALDRRLVRAVVLAESGGTSHTVLLARSLGIPVVGGVGIAALAGVDEVLVDGFRGLVVTRRPPAVDRFYARQSDALERRRRAGAGATSMTADGVRVETGANIASAGEAEAAFEAGAEGVGVVRTELMFTDRDTPPSEDEQYGACRAIVEAMRGRPVIFRTLDIGGDKPLSYAPLPPEANPFLGARGVRLYDDLGEIVDSQIRAMLRASAHGPVRLMAPMIASREEAVAFRGRVEAQKTVLEARGAAFDDAVPVGVMIEVPSAAFHVEALADVADFLSIGTNDLAQYWFAADRGNGRVRALAEVRHPSFLKLLAEAVDAAHRCGRWIGVCGDMARDPVNLPLLAGLGVDEISVPVPDVPALKTAWSGVSRAEGRRLLEKAMTLGSAGEVDALLAAQASPPPDKPLLSEALIDLDSAAENRAEAIRELVDRLDADGRAADADAVEAAVWAREDTCPTAMGFGFAVPHAKSDAVRAASLGMLRLRTPMEWGASDGQPVRTVFLLVMPAAGTANEHLKIFARLARRLVHEPFRAAVESAADAGALCEMLRREF